MPTKNEVSFLCYGTLMTVYVISLGLMAIVTRDLILTPNFGLAAAFTICAVIMLPAIYLLAWHFMCRAHIPRRNRSLWMLGAIWAMAQIWIESFSINEAGLIQTQTFSILFLICLCLTIAPVLLRHLAGRYQLG